MTVRVRTADEGDRAGILAVHLRAVRETCSRSYSAAQIDAWAGILSLDSYTSLLRRRRIIVAIDEAAIVGFGQLDPDAGEVLAVYVLPDRQGEGIGRRLLSELEKRARARGVHRLELSATLNAAGFYARTGYAQCRPTVHRTLSGVELPCVRMGKTLDGGAQRRRSTRVREAP